MSNKFTPWFPQDVKPARRGVYEIRPYHPTEVFYSYWNGKFWGFREDSVDGAHAYRAEPTLGPIVEWRGLTKEAA